VLVAPANDRLITAGEDFVVKVWDTTVSDGSTSLQVGPDPRIAFDRKRPELLWSLDSEGKLRVIDTVSAQRLGEIEAHPGGGAALELLSGSATVVTAGRDGYIQFWTWSDGGIHSARQAINHGTALLSIAASHNGRWVAGVDTFARLTVWEVAGGEQVFHEQLQGTDEGRPKTGRVAFNCDDTVLAAFGPGQSCHAFATTPFHPIDQRPQIAGTGGTAMMWHPMNRDFLLAADDQPRYTQLALGQCKLDRLNMGLNSPKSTCVAMTSSPDSRRWFLLQESGRVVVFDPDYLGEVLECQTTHGASDLAIDPSGRWLAVAHANGLVKILETGPRPNVERKKVDTRRDWLRSTLLQTKSKRINVTPRGVALDSEDRFCMLLIENAKDNDLGGDLLFVREDRDGAIQERVDPSGKVPWEGVCLAFGNGSDPVAVFRQRTGEAGREYDADIVITRRAGRGRWVEEQRVRVGNMGFYPAAVPQAGRVANVLHYSFVFAGGHLVNTSYDGSSWRHDLIGVHGDGYHQRAQVDERGEAHIVFHPMRYPGPPLYGRWDGKQLHREVIDPSAVAVHSIQLQPDGIPAAMLQRIGPAGANTLYIAQRTPNGWQQCAVVPADQSLFASDFCCGNDRQLYLLSWDPQRRRLLLWRGSGNEWSVTNIADDWESGPNWWTLRLDSHDRPVVVAARQGIEGACWIQVLRPQSWPAQ
jgi:hypothetical protein